MTDQIYQNKVARVDRVIEKGKVRFKVMRKADEKPAFVYDNRNDAISFAKHLETWTPMFEPKK